MWVPIFIIVHNHYEILKKTVKSFEEQISSPFRIVFHDVATTYIHTIDYLKEQQKKGYSVYRSNINNHHTVMLSVKDYMSKNKNCKYYVITDADITLDNVNGNILEFYIYLLEKYKVYSVGPMLRIDNIPDYYPRKQNAIQTHFKQFWSKTPQIENYDNSDYRFIFCSTDTTFQLSSIENIPPSFPHSNSIRCYAPYAAQHLDWYLDPNNLSDCQKYYMQTTSKISHWANPRWNGLDMCKNEIKKLI